MKHIYVLLLCFVVWQVKPQTITCPSSDFCSYNFITSPPYNAWTDIVISADRTYGKTNNQFKDVLYQNDELGNKCNGTLSDNCDPSNSELKYNVYYPSQSVYDYNNCGGLPCIIFVHGGGISDCSHYVQPGEGLDTLLHELARCGFVVFNVEYRRGRLIDPTKISGTIPLSVQQELANYAATQDTRGAIRSIIKRQINRVTDGFNDPYQIDINRIFLAGNSGGALSVLSAAFYQNQNIVNQVAPKAASSPYTLQDALGPIYPDYYYAENNNTSWSYNGRLKGLISLWGAVTVPPTVTDINGAADFFTTQNTDVSQLPPVISFQGKADNQVPCNSAYVYCSPDGHSLYNQTSFCLKPSFGHAFQTDIVEGSADLLAIGTEDFYSVLNKMNIPCESYIDCQMKHGLDDKDGSTFKSDFGTTYTTAAEVYQYIAQRACSFFQLVLGRTAAEIKPMKRKFIECRNRRTGCSTTDKYNMNCCPQCDNTLPKTDKCYTSQKDVFSLE